MLARQIGAIQEPYGVSDADMLLDAAGGGSGGGGTDTPAGGPIGITPQPLGPSLGPTGLNTAPPGSGGAPAGGGVTLSPTGVPGVSVVTPGPVGAGSDYSGIWWAIAGLGGAYLLSRGGGNAVAGVLGKKGSKLVPLLVVGGLGAYLLLKKPAAAVNPSPSQQPAGPTGGGGAQMAQVDVQRTYILNWPVSNGSNQAAIAAAVPMMTDTDINSFYNILLFISQQPVGWNGVLPDNLQIAFADIKSRYGIPGL